MAKDASALREEAAEATATGKYKRALAAYLELERLEPRDAQWPKRAGETYRRLGNPKHAIEAFNRSAERYAQNGFLVQAIAVCKLVLQIDPQHVDTLRRLAAMNEQIGQGPTRAGGMAENNPALHEDPNVAAIRRASAAAPPARAHPKSLPPALTLSRTRSKPIAVIRGAALDSVNLSQQVPASRPRDESAPGIVIIPLDEEDLELEGGEPAEAGLYDGAGVLIEVEPPDEGPDAAPDALDALDADALEDATVLELADVEEIPLPAPRALGAGARQALAATPLFAGLPSDAMEALVEHLALVMLEPGQELFREGEPSDALYVIVEGEVAVVSEGPPRAELQRLGPGAFIGEVALLTDQPRSSTVQSVTESELLRIDRFTLAQVLGEHGDMLRVVLRFVRDRLVDRWMSASPLFESFDDAQRAELASRFAFLEIEAGTRLLAAGSRPDGLYIVLAGQFGVWRGSRVLAVLGPGDLIGETALLSGGAFRSDVVALGKSLALCLPAADFREVIMTHPHVLEYLGEQAEHSRRLELL